MPTDPTTTTPSPPAASTPGNVFGPNEAADDAIARFDGTSGKLIQNSAIRITDGGALELRGASAIVRAAAKASGPGENLALLGGKVDGLGEGNGGAALLTGGDGDEGGQVQVAAGQSLDGDGGLASVLAGDGQGRDRAGGNVRITAGQPSGAGAPGHVSLGTTGGAVLIDGGNVVMVDGKTVDGVDVSVMDALVPDPWTMTSVQTAAYAANVWELVQCNPARGGFTVTMPSGVDVENGAEVIVKVVGASAVPVTIAAGPLDAIEPPGRVIAEGYGLVHLKYFDGAGTWRLVTQIDDRASRFQATKSGDVTCMDASFKDLEDWTQQTMVGEAFSFDATTGVLTFNDAGDYEVSAWVTAINTDTSNRAAAEFQIVDDTRGSVTPTPGCRLQLWLRHGGFGATASCRPIISVAAGDTCRLQVRRSSGSGTPVFQSDGCGVTARKLG